MKGFWPHARPGPFGFGGSRREPQKFNGFRAGHVSGRANLEAGALGATVRARGGARGTAGPSQPRRLPSGEVFELGVLWEAMYAMYVGAHFGALAW